MNQATHNQISALQLVVSALALSQRNNPDFNAVLSGYLKSEAFAAYSQEDQESVKISIERLIGHQLPG